MEHHHRPEVLLGWNVVTLHLNRYMEIAYIERHEYHLKGPDIDVIALEEPLRLYVQDDHDRLEIGYPESSEEPQTSD